MKLNRVSNSAQPVNSCGQRLAWRCSPSAATGSAVFGTRLPGYEGLPTARRSLPAIRHGLPGGPARNIASP
jgi:hypothetical protein